MAPSSRSRPFRHSRTSRRRLYLNPSEDRILSNPFLSRELLPKVQRAQLRFSRPAASARCMSPTGTSTTTTSSEVELRALGDDKIPYDTLKYVPEESAVHYRLAPLGIVDGV